MGSISVIPPRVLLFDGVCVLCNRTSRLVMRHDRRARISLASLQSNLGKALLRNNDLDPEAMDTLVYLRKGRVFIRSSAALRLAMDMDGLWPILGVLLIIPRPIRDWVYDRVARKRYRWFGKYDSCPMPGPEQKGRFLDLPG